MYCSSITYHSHALFALHAPGIGFAMLRRTSFRMETTNMLLCINRYMLVSSAYTLALRKCKVTKNTIILSWGISFFQIPVLPDPVPESTLFFDRMNL
jgi:cation transport ATPase